MNKAILLFLLFLLIIKCRCENSRSLFLRKFLGVKYICNKTSCSPSTIIFGKNQVQCEISCLNDLQCYLLTFDLSNNQCEIFSSISIDYGNLIQQQNVITMITLDNEQLFNSMLNNITETPTIESTMASRITATSTNTGDAITTNRETTTSSSTTITTATITTTSSTTSSTSSILRQLPQLVKPVLPRVLQVLLPQVPRVLLHHLVPPRVLQVPLPQVPRALLHHLVPRRLLQVQLPRVLQVQLPRVLQVPLPQIVLPRLVLPRLLQAVLVQVQQQQQIHVSISGNLLWNKTGITVLGSSAAPVPASGVFLDSNDTLYAADEAGHYVVWKLLKNAINATIVAGTYGLIGLNSSQLYFPNDVYVDRSGNMYVTDMGNNRIQKYINKSTNAITIAGNSTFGSALNLLGNPHYFTFDPTETYMYVADSGNNRILRLSTNSTSGTNGILVAGGSGANNTNTSLYTPWGIHYLPSISNDLFITNAGGHSVIRWTPGASSGTFVAGVPGISGSDSTHLNTPMGIKIDNYLNMYVVDYNNNRVQLFCANSNVGITIVGNGTAGNSATQLNSPRGIAFDSAMNMYIGDDVNNRVQKFMKL
ncbi:unnamed protein product [Adineta steineri]|uniref:SMP-30/Gluconolactonase/LRE-like region domain-containing protein n=1 Tax=Adineta steineri TaxID=433720 RepID=A0A818NH39_9BILA|nr:unnamed protein product [Adineta steineri]